MSRKILWGVPVSIWLLFTLWYTDMGGPLTDEEVTAGIKVLAANGYNPEKLVRVEKFLREDTGRQFLMVNNIDRREDPLPMPGFGPDATAEDYRNYYMEHMYAQLLKRACHPIFVGTGLGYVADLTGVEGAATSNWDSAALFRYRSRRSLLEIISHPAMQERHGYKIAAMTKTIAYPVEPDLYVSDLRIVLFLVLGLLTAMTDILIFGRRRANTIN